MRLLSTYLGEMFYVGAAILFCFMFGLGVGALQAWRFVHRLWLVEIGIGLYAAVMAFAFNSDPLATLALAGAASGHSLAATVAVIFAALIVPATLIGFSVPMFSLYASPEDAPSAGFQRIYLLYNLGAVLCVLAIEYLLLRSLGIRAAILLLAAVNFLIGLRLRQVTPRMPVCGDRSPVPASLLAALVLISIASGMWQLLMFKYAEQAFGPFHENFTLTVALGLGCLALGTWFVAGRKVPVGGWLLSGTLLLAASTLAIDPVAALWAALNESFGQWPGAPPVLKMIVLALLGGAPLCIFGAAIPLLLRSLPATGTNTAGKLLATSSFANATGYLLMVLFVHEHLDYRMTVALVVLLLGAATLLLRRDGATLRRAAIATGLAALLALAAPALTYLDFGYDILRSPSKIAAFKAGFESMETTKRFDTRVDVLRLSHGIEMVNINGYYTVATNEYGQPNFKEVVFGLTPGLFAPSREHALVLGLGTGITGGSVASVFEKTTAVEINPAMHALLRRFSAQNFGIADNPRVDIRIQDALTTLATDDTRYDAIVNTVTSPIYFSSSKLYTSEFFQLVSSRLKPGGVYALWFDSRVTEQGARIIFSTLTRHFSSCVLVNIATAYMQLICSNRPLVPQPVPISEAVGAVFAAEVPGIAPNRFLGSLIFTDHGIHRTPWLTPPNTLDRPALEFLMSGIVLGDGEKSDFLRLADVDVRASLLGANLGGDALAERCFALRVMGGTQERCIAAMAAEHGGLLPPSYSGAVLRWMAANKSGYVKNWDEVLFLLEHLVLADNAADRPLITHWLERIAVRPIESPADMHRKFGAAMLEARLALLAGRPVSDAMLARIVAAANPLNPATLEMLALAAAQRHDLAATQQQLELLRGIGTDPAVVERVGQQVQRLSRRDD